MISIVIPVRNGGTDLARCLDAIAAQRVEDEVETVVIDSSSTDGSAELARSRGARVEVIAQADFRHGSARNLGAELARGEVLVFTTQDAYPADDRWLATLCRPLTENPNVAAVYGRQLPHDDARPPERRIGNPILSGFLNVVYRTPIGDAHCGLRAIRRDALARLDLHSTGMEFASEMVIRAVRAGLDIREQPIALHVRGGDSKLSPLRDGWRHLRLMLVYSPGFLFLVPGAVMIVVGLLTIVTVPRT